MPFTLQIEFEFGKPSLVFLGFRRVFSGGLFLELRRDFRAPVSLEEVAWSSVAHWRDLGAAGVFWERSRSLGCCCYGVGGIGELVCC